MNKTFFDLSVKFEFGASQRLKFYAKLSQLLENGVPLDTALSQIQKTTVRTKGSVLPVLYARWRRSVANGMNFGKCLAPYIPSSEAILLETGADSGRLVDALRNAHQSVEQQSKVKGAIIKSSAYPFVLILMLIGALVLCSFMVIPTFEQIIPIEQWEGVPYMVAIASQFIREKGLLILIGLIGLTTLVTLSMPRWAGKSRIAFDNIVPYNFYRMWQGSAFLLSVSSMMAAGVKLDEMSLGRISKNSDPYLRTRVKAIQRWMSAGANFGDALAQAGYNFPDPELISDLQIYANLKGFDKNITKITNDWVGELIETVQSAMQVVNFIVLFLIAVVIGLLITAFFGIFQQINSSTNV